MALHPSSYKPDLKASVIIPAFSEAGTIQAVIEDVRGSLGAGDEVVVVDDGSRDATADVALRAGATVIEHPFNLGQGSAIQTGIEYGLSDPSVQILATFDADGQHDAADLQAMRLRLENDADLDIVLGSRKGQDMAVPKPKRLLLEAGVMFTWLLTGLRLSDTHNGLRVFRRRFAEQVSIGMSDMAHASELIALVARGDFNYVEHPVTIRYTEYSRGKGQSMLNAVNIGFDVLLERVARLK